MLPDAGFFIHSLQKQDASKAYMFIQGHGDGSSGLSLQSCYQFASSIFICYNQFSEWIGLIATYQSPENRGTAVLETIVIPKDWRRKGIAGLLANHALNYWKSKCIFRLSYMPDVLSEAGRSLLQKFNFRPKDKDGFTEFVLKILPEKICMHNRVMRPSMNTINGEISEDTLFEYFQKDDLIWGTYSGGKISRGVLLGKMTANGDISFEYMQVCTNGEVLTGTSQSSTEFLNDGRIILYEDWEWTGKRSGGGRSVIEEVKEL